MFNGRRIGFLWIIFFAASTVVKAKTKYYDGEARPYEFGYRIEGNQHRHEKKDADGIINGEFGFITGDGVYHQTVYATDENGNFKLVSLKTSFKFEKPTTTTAPPTTASPPAPTSAAPHSVKLLKSCSDCRVFERVVNDKTGQDDTGARTRKGEAVEISMPITPNINDLPKMRINSNNGTIGTISPMNIALGISSAGIRASEEIKLKRKEITKSKGNISAPNRNGPSINKASPRNNEHDNTKTPNEIPPSHPTSKPVHSAQVVIPVSLQTKSEITVPVSTDHITNNKPVESSKTHLNSKQAINHFIGDVLYRFNYTAGYHGHNEEGDSAGNKRGGYFIVGRDNIRRGVIYVANENGFVPMVRYEKVSPAEAPHEDSEKSAGLRGYEFEWFHKGKSRGDSVNDSRR